LIEYEGERAYQDVLLPWQDNADQAMNVLKNYGEIEARLILDQDIIEHIWDLYALSRVYFLFRKATVMVVPGRAPRSLRRRGKHILSRWG
jgi:hypothetical protein